MKTNFNNKVFVAMSGGVDSSVTAFLLKKKGFEVTGVYMKNWSEESFSGKFSSRCPWNQDLQDVKRVCQKLEIPVKVYSFEKEYNKRVIDYFFKGETKGLTPNPDIICNREIKFGLFLKKALADGANFIATGHYARLREVKGQNAKVKKYELLQAYDKNKDQTYFLCLLNQKQLARTLFPLGTYKKSKVREIARTLGLPTAEKPESMGICFVGEIKLEDFLKVRLREKAGNIVDTTGRIIGKHKGLPFYTIGQRQGLCLGGGVPYFVVEKKLMTNELIVAKGSRNKKLFQRTVYVKNFNWISGKIPKLPLICKARIRHRQKLQTAVIRKKEHRLIVEFGRTQRAVTPGQFCAVYKNQVLLGGGEIL